MRLLLTLSRDQITACIPTQVMHRKSFDFLRNCVQWPTAAHQFSLFTYLNACLAAECKRCSRTSGESGSLLGGKRLGRLAAGWQKAQNKQANVHGEPGVVLTRSCMNKVTCPYPRRSMDRAGKHGETAVANFELCTCAGVCRFDFGTPKVCKIFLSETSSKNGWSHRGHNTQACHVVEVPEMFPAFFVAARYGSPYWNSAYAARSIGMRA
jgi:hypothetical protein